MARNPGDQFGLMLRSPLSLSFETAALILSSHLILRDARFAGSSG